MIGGTILEEKEEQRKKLQEMEERLKNRNTKSQHQVIVKNPLEIDENDYDTKVYKNTITKNDRMEEVQMVDEGK